MAFHIQDAFDETFYRAQFSQDEAAFDDALNHYTQIGWREGKRPHKWFDSAWYLTRYPDVAAHQFEPLSHYLTLGWGEGRHPHPAFDNNVYCFEHPAIVEAGVSPLQHVIENPSQGAAIKPVTLPPFIVPDAMQWPSFQPNMGKLPHSSPDTQKAQVNAYRAARKKNNRVALLTSITNNYDTLRLPAHLSPHIDYFVYTDDSQMSGLGVFNVGAINGNPLEGPRSLSRMAKFHPDVLLGDYDVVIWCDANVLIREDIMPFVEAFRASKQPLAFLQHPLRNCFYTEAIACVEQHKESLVLATRQVARLRARGLPDNTGLIEANLFACRPAMSLARRFFREWFREFEQGSSRDQLCSSYAFWKLGLTYHPFLGKGFHTRNHPATVLMEHGHQDSDSFSHLRELWKPSAPAKTITLPRPLERGRWLKVIARALGFGRAGV